ncbi:hypothetical protein GCM10029964_079040 [Kibdelosporangium lantanae]
MNVKIVAVAAVVLGVTACSNPSGKSWAITYEVTGQSEGPLAEVTYANSPNRYEDKVADHKVTGPVGTPGKKRWSSPPARKPR